jgi:aspartyl-tRNA(Asn)/glutamyl-tRNA(Gln) amidotransferase subunit C
LPNPAQISPLTTDEVRHIARLARLRPSDAEIERYRAQLASILEHVARLNELDVAGIEPLTHAGGRGPGGATNRFDADEPQPPMSLEALTTNAPAMEGRYLAVPKVLDDAADAGEGGG